MKALLRLACKDLAQRPFRSALTLLLLLLPSFAFVAIISMTTTPPPKLQTALASLPTGVQARITATAVSDNGQPFQQAVTGLPQWIDDPGQVPTDQSAISALLPADTRLLPYWTFPNIIVAASPHAEPGITVGKHNLESALAEAGIASMSPATYAEANTELLPLLTAQLSSGTLPGSAAEAVISAGLSTKTGLTVGSTLIVIAPPATGWISNSGFINQVAEGQQRHLRVCGIMEGNDSTVWSHPGWLSEAISAKPAGIDRTFLAFGPSPIQWEQVTELNKLRVITISREVLNNPPPETNRLARFLSQTNPENISTALAIACCIGFIVVALTMSVFRLTAEQQRRLLGLLSIIGVEPSQLSLWLRLQGVILGALAGLLGSTLGAATVLGVLHIIRPGVSYLDVFTWWTVIVGIFGTALAGLIAGETSARWAAKQPPLDAYDEKPKPLPTASRALTIPLILLVITVITGICALIAPTPDLLRLPAAISCSLALTVGLIIITIRGPRWISTTHLSPRLRFIACELRTDARGIASATTVTALTMALVCLQLMLLASQADADRINKESLTAWGSPTIALETPVSNTFDTAVMDQATTDIRQHFPIISSHPIYSGTTSTQKLYVEALHDSKNRCGTSYYPAPNVIRGVVPFNCDPSHPWYPQAIQVSWLDADYFVMDGAAARATNAPHADAIARLLDNGGVLTPDFSAIVDGTITLVARDQPDEPTAIRTTATFPALHAPGFGNFLVLSPKAAQELGLTSNLRLVGQVIEPEAPMTYIKTQQLKRYLAQNHPLIRVTLPTPAWSDFINVVLAIGIAAFGALATILITSLRRIQASPDMTTMTAMGAAPRFIRGLGIMQALCLHISGTLAGIVAGLASGWIIIHSLDQLSQGGWPVTSVAWFPIVSYICLSTIAVALTGALFSRSGTELRCRDRR